MFNNSEVVEKIHGLNNVSTLERWRRIAEKEAGILFPKKTLQNKRGFSYTRYQYTPDDIAKFQLVANEKSTLGLSKAIMKAFLGEQVAQSHRSTTSSASTSSILPSPPSFEERINVLEKKFCQYKEETNAVLTRIIKENLELKEMISEQMKRKSLFGR